MMHGYEYVWLTRSNDLARPGTSNDRRNSFRGKSESGAHTAHSQSRLMGLEQGEENFMSTADDDVQGAGRILR